MATPMHREPVVFRTKVDRWLVVVLVVSLLGVLVAMAASYEADPSATWTGAVIPVVVLLLVAALTLPTRYVLTAHALVVRFGLFRMTIPLTAIERVYPTRNPLSAPAWSLDRLGIDYRVASRRRLMLISPAERDAFLSLLAERAGLERRGDELERVA